MDMFEEARALKTMIAMCKLTQNEIAKKMGVSQSYIANKLRLLKFSEEAKAAIMTCGISERHARTLLRIDEESTLLDAIKKTAERKLTVAECEAMVDVLVESRSSVKLKGKAERSERIEKFEGFISSSVASLCSMGIEARIDRAFHGRKRYITVVIEDY